MLKFFRKIREKLMVEGRLSKYVLYATGEILLVVAGILIALQINNWNEDRKVKATIKIHLQNIIADLRNDSITLEGIKYNSLFQYHSLQYLLKMAGEKNFVPEKDDMREPPFQGIRQWQKPVPEDYDREFIHLAFLWSHRIPLFKSNRSTLEEMKSTGLYSNLQNQELKAALVTYYNRWEWTFHVSMEELIEKWQQLLEEDGIITSDVYRNDNDPINLIKNHPERIAVIHRLLRETGWWAERSAIVWLNGQSLIAMIQKELVGS